MHSSIFHSVSTVANLWPILVDSALKGAALLALTALAVLFCRRASAATRHLLWFLGMMGALAMPVLSAALPAWQILPTWKTAEPISPTPTLLATAIPAAPIAPLADTQLLPLYEPPRPSVALVALPPAPVVVPTRVFSISDWAIVLWLAGAVAVLLRLAVALLNLWRLERRARPITIGPWPILLRQACAQLGVKRPVALLSSPARTMPMVWGILSPRILLPVDCENWPPDQRRAVLLHELAHIRRRDCLCQLLAHLACAAHWFNPLAWAAWRRMQTERERACDDLVLGTGATASSYAEQLLALATQLPRRPLGAAAIAMARPGTLEGRLLAILDSARNRRAVTWSATIIALALTVALVVPLAMVKAADANKANVSSTSQPADDAPRAGTSPQLRFLAWQPDDPEQLLEGWHADGSPVTDAKEKRLLDYLRPTRMDSPSEGPFLHLSFAHPDFDIKSEIQVTLLALNGQSIELAPPGSVAWNVRDRNSAYDDTGWAHYTLSPGRRGQIPEAVKVRLHYALGEWRYHRTISPEFSGAMSLGNAAQLGAIGQNIKGQAFITLSRNRTKSADTQYDFQAVTRDGRTLDSRKGSGGFADLMNETFTFDVPLAQVKEFKFRTRTIRTAVFENVSLVAGKSPATQAAASVTDDLQLVVPARAESFAPTRERIITLADADAQGLVFFSMARGQSIKPPFALKLKEAFPGLVEFTPALWKWADEVGADVLIQLRPRDILWSSLRMQEDFVGQMQDWERLTPQQIQDIFVRKDTQGLVSGDFPSNWSGGDYSGQYWSICQAFRTRSGQIGVLQWMGIRNPQPALKLRYRLVQGTRPAATQPIATQPIRSIAPEKLLGTWRVRSEPNTSGAEKVIFLPDGAYILLCREETGTFQLLRGTYTITNGRMIAGISADQQRPYDITLGDNLLVVTDVETHNVYVLDFESSSTDVTALMDRVTTLPATRNLTTREANSLSADVEKVIQRLSTLAENDPQVPQLLKTVEQLDHALAAAEIAHYIESPQPTIRRAAIYLCWRARLKTIAPAIEPLMKACGNDEDLTRGMAALALGSRRVVASYPVLVKLATTDPSGYTRRCAAYALGTLGNPDALDTLRKIRANDSDSLVRNNADAAIMLLIGPASRVSSSTTRTASDSAPPNTVEQSSRLSLPNSDQQRIQAAEKVVDLMAAKEFEQVTRLFDKRMKQLVPAIHLSAVWNQLEHAGGKYLGRRPSRVSREHGYDCVYMPLAWEKNRVEMKVVFDAEGRVAGLWTLPPRPTTEQAMAATRAAAGDPYQHPRLKEMRTVLQAMAMFVADHKGEFPETLQPLKRYLGESANIDLDAYAYIKPPARPRAEGKRPVLLERMQVRTDGEFVGFDDTHVEFLKFDQTQKLLAEFAPPAKLEFRVAMLLSPDGRADYPYIAPEAMNQWIRAFPEQGPKMFAADAPVKWVELDTPVYGNVLVLSYEKRPYLLVANMPDYIMNAPDAGRPAWGLRRAYLERDEWNSLAVGATFDKAGSERFGKLTEANLDRPLVVIVNNKVVWVPIIRSKITASAIIIGGKQISDVAAVRLLAAGLQRDMPPTTAPSAR